ncbi:MAG: NADH-quinone oxidoreductase subunit L [Acidimicrobiia bacterium]|nr:NADH-quinone oxidoreductase subunit L [Acidimicrobiia bacterium]
MEIFWLLPILNIAACFLTFFFARSVTKSKAHLWTVPVVGFSWLVALFAVGQIIVGHDVVNQSKEWFDFGAGSVRMGVHIDGFAVVMMVVVTSISLAMQVYSISYMRGEVRYVTYYAIIALFTSGMMILVTADNLFLAIFGWEIMGLCSYMLIGHYHEDVANSTAAIKAFLTTRTGDLGLLIGSIMCFWAVRTFDIEAINVAAVEGVFGGHLLEVAAIALCIGVIGKSAQFPLHTWLPDAMAGPTPVSSLIHAATMVVAGVYLVARMFPVFAEAFDIGQFGGIESVHLIALVGGVTALVGAFLALVQWDLKKVLAYSTISQLGYMIFGLGVGAWGAAVFHLFTHAFFKALLFLGSGSVIHAVHTQDMRDMGGLRKVMPRTYWTWIIGTLALCGVFPAAGFFSKDEILAGAWHNSYQWVWVLGLLGAFLTAFYMFRATHLTFHGDYRGHGHPHESDNWITGVLIALAIPSAVIGFIGLPGQLNLFDGWFEPHVVHEIVERYGLVNESLDTTTWVLAAVSLAVAAAGIILASMLFLPKWRDSWVPEGLHSGWTTRPPLSYARTFLERKLYLDSLYGTLTLWVRDSASRAMYWTNMHIVDRVIDLTGAASLQLGKGFYMFDQDGLDGFYNGLAAVTNRGGRELRRTQTGQVQQYAGVLFAAAAIFGIFFILVN